MIEQKLKNYREMLEIAKGISSSARVRKLEMNEQWEIYIPTEFTADWNLPDNYRDTPAWDAFQEHDYSYGGSKLAQWGENRFSDLPIDGIADYYNLETLISIRVDELMQEFEMSTGIKLANVKTLARNEVVQWQRALTKIRDDVRAEFSNQRAALDAMWKM